MLPSALRSLALAAFIACVAAPATALGAEQRHFDPTGGEPAGSTLSRAGVSVTYVPITYTVEPRVFLGTPAILSPTSVLLLGSSEGLGGNVTTHFEYGTGTSYGRQTPESAPAPTVFASAVVTDLEPATTYHYRLVATRVNGGVGRSQDATFTTPSVQQAVLRLITAYARLDNRGRVALKLRCSKGERSCSARLLADWLNSPGNRRRKLAVEPGTQRVIRIRAPRAVRDALATEPVARLRVTLTGLGATTVSPKTRTLPVRPSA